MSSNISLSSKTGDIYPFFLLHMGIFGGVSFAFAYISTSPPGLFVLFFGAIGMIAYCSAYVEIFGLDSVKLMFINALLGVFGTFSQMGYLVENAFGREISSYPLSSNIIPMLYFVLYTFLLRQLVMDIFGARNNPHRLFIVNNLYVLGLLTFYFLTYYLRTG